jgi:hypothetical protein
MAMVAADLPDLVEMKNRDTQIRGGKACSEHPFHPSLGQFKMS